MLATEPTGTGGTRADSAIESPALPPLETWQGNERMRHIPSVEWMIRKVHSDLRLTVEKSLTPILGLASDDPRLEHTDEELRNLCRALDRLAEAAQHGRNGQQGGQQADLPHRVESAFDHAAENLRSLDADLIGRRFPYHAFERSKAEPLYGALLVVMRLADRIVVLAREIEPGIDERLLEGLVVLQDPVDERMLHPIA